MLKPGLTTGPVDNNHFHMVYDEPLDLRKLRAFTMVVEEGGFTAAAEALGVSAAAISKQVAALEQELNVTLLHRTSRNVKLSAAGSALLGHAKRLLLDAARAREFATSASHQIDGSLRVTAPLGAGRWLLGPAVAEFARRHPSVDIDLVIDDAARNLIEERFDIAVRIGELPDSTLRARKIATMELLVCAAPAYLSQRGIPKTPADLEAHEWIRFSPLGDPTVLEFRAGRRTQRVRLPSRIAVNDGAVLRTLTLRGLGTTVLPSFWIEDDVRSGRLVRLLEGWTLPTAPVHALHTHASRPPKKVRAFIDFLVEWVKAQRA